MEIGSFEMGCNTSFTESAGERYLFMIRLRIKWILFCLAPIYEQTVLHFAMNNGRAS